MREKDPSFLSRLANRLGNLFGREDNPLNKDILEQIKSAEADVKRYTKNASEERKLAKTSKKNREKAKDHIRRAKGYDDLALKSRQRITRLKKTPVVLDESESSIFTPEDIDHGITQQQINESLNEANVALAATNNVEQGNPDDQVPEITELSDSEDLPLSLNEKPKKKPNVISTMWSGVRSFFSKSPETLIVEDKDSDLKVTTTAEVDIQDTSKEKETVPPKVKRKPDPELRRRHEAFLKEKGLYKKNSNKTHEFPKAKNAWDVGTAWTQKKAKDGESEWRLNPNIPSVNSPTRPKSKMKPVIRGDDGVDSRSNEKYDPEFEAKKKEWMLIEKKIETTATELTNKYFPKKDSHEKLLSMDEKTESQSTTSYKPTYADMSDVTSSSKKDFYKEEADAPIKRVEKLLRSGQKFEIIGRLNPEMTSAAKPEISDVKYQINSSSLSGEFRAQNLVEFLNHAWKSGHLSGKFKNGMKLTGTEKTVRDAICILHALGYKGDLNIHVPGKSPIKFNFAEAAFNSNSLDSRLSQIELSFGAIQKFKENNQGFIDKSSIVRDLAHPEAELQKEYNASRSIIKK